VFARLAELGTLNWMHSTSLYRSRDTHFRRVFLKRGLFGLNWNALEKARTAQPPQRAANKEAR
jgi:hypothetical protein